MLACVGVVIYDLGALNNANSKKLFERAQDVLVGGVNSPVRAFKNVSGVPVFFKRGEGAYLFDVDGNKYIDFVGAWGPMILGHCNNEATLAIKEAAASGTAFGAPVEEEILLAEKIRAHFSSMEMVRFTNSGTEAVMGALRVARGFTKRNKIIKFDGCYHGGADHMLVKAGSGALTFGTPDSAGVPESFAKETIVARYNDIASVEAAFKNNASDIAGVIVEPVAGNIGCVPPVSGFLEGLRSLCTKYGALLIFDEVMTGFRVSIGGAQKLYNIKPDLTTLGKIIGGGLPVGAYGGRREIMSMVAPIGPVYQAGTFSGNRITMMAGLATLKVLERGGFYERLEETSGILCTKLSALFAEKEIPCKVNRVGSMWSVFFTNKEVRYLEDVLGSDKEGFKRFFFHMLENGIYLAPSPFESNFVSSAHSREDIERVIDRLGLLPLK